MSDVLMLVTNEYRPDPRVHKEAKALIDGGHVVTVAAWDRLRSRPPVEEVEGVRLHRVRTGKVGGQLALVLNYPLFLLRSLGAARAIRPDIVHAHDLDTLPIGLLIARLRRIPVVYDAHERYAKMIAMDVPAAVSRLVERFERSLLPKADLVITINEAMAAELEKHSRDEVVVIMNVIELPPASKVKAHRPHDVIVLFNPVTFEPMRYLEESMEAAAKINGCILRLAGSGRLLPAVERAAKEHANVEFLGHLPFTKLMEEYEKVDVVLILADPANENYRTGTANKMGEGMAFGLPLLASRGTLSADVVEREGCGLTFDWSEENFRQAIDRLRDAAFREEMGRKGRAAAEREYNWGAMRERLQAAYRRLLSPAQ
ncbi:MAG: glycosyltransferase family 4 protein [Methanomassiliicoccus sp.]|nr:glycosyltransferase family 4 protein [Methanomassiliicoccus sp.]